MDWLETEMRRDKNGEVKPTLAWGDKSGVRLPPADQLKQSADTRHESPPAPQTADPITPS